MPIPLTAAEDRVAAAFAAAAETFCGVLDTHRGSRPASFVRASHRALADLYLAALDLPDVSPEDKGTRTDPITTDAEGALSLALAETMAPFHIHWFVFDPVKDEPEEPVASSLPHDLAEIYRDVRNSCAGWAAPESRRDAVWEMRFAFSTHWGRHAVHAMVAMHSLLYDQYMEALKDA